MRVNGTYADYRDRLQVMMEKGKISPQALALHDAQWAAMPIETKQKARDQVIEDTRLRPAKDGEGKNTLIATPSDNGAAKIAKAQLRKTPSYKSSPGSIASRPNPLAGEMAAKAAAGALPSVPQSGAGQNIPQAVRPPVGVGMKVGSMPAMSPVAAAA